MRILELHPPAKFIVCESSIRWQSAMFRFANQFVPQNMVARVEAAEPNQVRSLARSAHPVVVLWEVDWGPASLSPMDSRDLKVILSQVSSLRAASPRVIQFVVGAAAGPANASAMSFAEMGIVGFIWQPEHLDRWRRYFRGHFARTAGDLE